eukprot:2746603-Prymnesium_polylepis.1
MEMLIGKSRDPSLRDRALIAFPHKQTMPSAAAAEHVGCSPNNHFVWRRADDTFAVAHCWPVKYNEGFRRTFNCSEENPDDTLFSP